MKNKALTKYTKALTAVADFKKKHKKLFDDYGSLILAVTNTETELKNDVRDNVKATISNDLIKVMYSPVWLKTYDSDIIMGGVTPKVKKQMITDGVIVTTVKIDKKKLETFVESGKLPAEVKQAAFSEAPGTPRITIKENK